MRKLKNLLLAALLILGVAVLLPVKAQAATKVTFTYTDHSVTVKWKEPDLSTGSTVKNYTIYYQVHSKDEDNNNTTIWKSRSGISASTTSWTKSKLPIGYISRWKLECIYQDAEGVLKTDSTYFYVNTTLPKYETHNTSDNVSADNYGITYADDTTGEISFSALKYPAFSGLKTSLFSSHTGYQLQLYKGKKLVNTFTSNYTTITLKEKNIVSRDTVYKYRIRASYTNPDTQKTVYGPWSDFKYFDFSTATLTTKQGVQGAKLTVKKVAGVSKYIIKVKAFKANDPNKNTGYTKTMTITIPSSDKKKTVNITKIGSKVLKKGKSYYVQVIPCIKAGSKTVQSDIISTFRFYNYK